MGHILTPNGLKADPDKLKAILKMENPTDVAGVQRLIGTVNYLARFLPNLSSVCDELRQLTKKHVEFCWTFHHDYAIQQIKAAITTAPVLRYFDPRMDITLQCDASEKGLGASLMQQGHPVAYASRALTDTETRYAQIEKELLAIVFGVTKFHHYAYGRHMTIESDHKPLEVIVQKPIHSAPKRLQRMLVQLQGYDITVTYKRGKEMFVADTLSRAYLQGQSNHIPSTNGCESINLLQSVFERELEFVNLCQHLPISEARRGEIQVATEQDECLQEVKQLVMRGWPQSKTQVPRTVAPYFPWRDEIGVQNGVLFRGERIIVPGAIRQKIMTALHSSHIGINGCLRRARELFYWPGMNDHVKTFI